MIPKTRRKKNKIKGRKRKGRLGGDENLGAARKMPGSGKTGTSRGGPVSSRGWLSLCGGKRQEERSPGEALLQLRAAEAGRQWGAAALFGGLEGVLKGGERALGEPSLGLGSWFKLVHCRKRKVELT